MTKKSGKQGKKNARTVAGSTNSILKATIVSKPEDTSYAPLGSAMNSIRRTFSMPRTLLSKKRSDTQLPMPTFAETRYGVSTLSAAVSRSTGTYGTQGWLPHPLKRLKFGLISILVIIGLGIGILSATHFNGPYSDASSRGLSWFKGTRLAHFFASKNESTQEKVLKVEAIPDATPKTADKVAPQAALTKKIEAPTMKKNKKVKSKAKTKAKTKGKAKSQVKKSST